MACKGKGKGSKKSKGGSKKEMLRRGIQNGSNRKT